MNMENNAEHWMNEAARAAAKAMCHRAKCGAVIISGGEVIGSGYNAPPGDDEKNRMCDSVIGPGKPKYDKTCCVHAEWRAIMDAIERRPGNVAGSTLYFARVDNDGKITRSGKPYCTVCSRLALDAGIAKFVLWHEEGIREYPTDEYNLLSYQYNDQSQGMAGSYAG